MLVSSLLKRDKKYVKLCKGIVKQRNWKLVLKKCEDRNYYGHLKYKEGSRNCELRFRNKIINIYHTLIWQENYCKKLGLINE